MRNKVLVVICLLILSVMGDGLDDDELKPKPRTREQINASLDQEHNGVYFLNEANFDDFINYNDLVLICFYETGDTEPIISEMLASIKRRVAEQH